MLHQLCNSGIWLVLCSSVRHDCAKWIWRFGEEKVRGTHYRLTMTFSYAVRSVRKKILFRIHSLWCEWITESRIL